jgi:hypothetical protein
MIILDCYGAAPIRATWIAHLGMVHGDERRPDRACVASKAKPIDTRCLADQHGRNR